jgi:hypothetical protein
VFWRTWQVDWRKKSISTILLTLDSFLRPLFVRLPNMLDTIKHSIISKIGYSSKIKWFATLVCNRRISAVNKLRMISNHYKLIKTIYRQIVIRALYMNHSVRLFVTQQDVFKGNPGKIKKIDFDNSSETRIFKTFVTTKAFDTIKTIHHKHKIGYSSKLDRKWFYTLVCNRRISARNY